jgi:hypothetical protein
MMQIVGQHIRHMLPLCLVLFHHVLIGPLFRLPAFPFFALSLEPLIIAAVYLYPFIGSFVSFPAYQSDQAIVWYGIGVVPEARRRY